MARVRFPLMILMDEDSMDYWTRFCREQDVPIEEYLPTLLKEWEPETVGQHGQTLLV